MVRFVSVAFTVPDSWPGSSTIETWSPARLCHPRVASGLKTCIEASGAS